MIADLGHASPRWVGYANALNALGIEIHIFTPKMSRGQSKFLGIQLRSGIKLHQSVSYRMSYKMMSHLNPVSRRLTVFLGNRFTNHGRSFTSDFQENQLDLVQAWRTEIAGVIAKIREPQVDEILISSSSPFDCHVIGSSLAQEFNLNWFPDYRDLHSLNHNLPSVDQGMLLAEQDVLTKAKGVITTSVSFSVKMKEITSNPVYVLRNGFERSVEKTGINRRKSRIVYTGQIYPKSQNLSMFLDAIYEFNSSNTRNIDFFLYGTSSNLIHKYFIDRESHIPSWVKLRREIPRAKSWRIQKNADALLLFDWKDEGKGIPLTTKLYEYLSAATPILLITENESSETISIIENSNSGLVCRCSHEIDSFLRQLSSDTLKFPIPNNEFIETLSFEYQAKLLLDWIKSQLD